MRSPLARLLGVAVGVAVVWGCSEVLAPGVQRFRGPTAQVIDPRCCPNNAASGCGCPGTIFGSSNGTGDTAGVAIYVTQNLICPSRLGTATTGAGGPPLLNGEPWPDSVTVYVAVDSGGEGNHLLGRTITLMVEVVDSSSTGSDAPYGHSHTGHNGAVKPAGTLSQMTVNTGQQGLVVLSYRAGEVSGPITIRAQSTGVAENRVSLAVGVPGLIPMVQRPSDTLIGYVWAHPVNHHGLPIMVAKLDTLADDFFVKFHTRIHYNDMALPLGGKFDLDSLWGQVARRHAEHRAGRDIDVRITNMSLAQQSFVDARWQQLGGSVWPEGTPPHKHLRYRGPE